MPTIYKQRITLGILLAVLTLSALIAVNNGKNDINKYLLQEHLNYWVKNEAGREKEWDKAHHYFEQATSSYTADPDTLAYGARLYEWAAILAESKSKPDDMTVYTFHINSIQLRPLWPYGWKDLAVSLSKEGHHGDKFQEAFRNTILLGHQEDRIQIELSDIGLHQWSQLSVDNRKLFIPFLRNAARKHALKLTRLKHNKMSRLILCGGVRNNPSITTYCNSK